MTRMAWRADASQVLTLAAPLVLTQLAQVAQGTTSIVMLGQLDTVDLAAGGLALSLFNLLRTMGVGLITPTGNLVAEASVDAQGGAPRIRALLCASLALATAAGLLAALLMVLGAPLLRGLGQDPRVVERCGQYLAAAAPGLLPLLWFQVLRQLTVGLGRPGPMLAVTLASVGLNAVLAYALMKGAGGLPALGLSGVAIAGTVVNALALGALLWVARRDPRVAPLLSLRYETSPWPAWRRLARLGLPVAASYGSEAAFFSVLGLLAGAFGPTALAAHTVLNQLVYVVFMVAVGLSQAVSLCISRAWAHGDGPRARRLGLTALGLGWIAMAGAGLLYLAAPLEVLGLLLRPGSSGEVAAQAAALLGIVAVLQCFDCSQNLAIGMLRGVGETASAFLRTLLGYWGVGLPLAWWLGWVLQLGLSGLWLGLASGLATTAGLLLLRFVQVTAAARHRSPTAMVQGGPA